MIGPRFGTKAASITENWKKKTFLEPFFLKKKIRILNRY